MREQKRKRKYDRWGLLCCAIFLVKSRCHKFWQVTTSRNSSTVQGPTIDRSNGKKLCSRVSLGTLSTPQQGCRKWGGRGDHAPRADQLTLSQPKGSDYALQLLQAPQIFRPSDIPALYHCCTAYYYREQPLYSLRYEHSMGAWQMFRHIFRTISTLRLF